MSWQIDPAHSVVEFSVRHMMISRVRGRFHKFDGTFNLDEEHPERSWVEFTVHVDSIDTGEPNRDNHLRSADFFDVASFPTMTFRSTAIERAGPNTYRVKGDLTIRGVTRPVELEVTDEGRTKDPWGNERWGFSVRTAINRKDFGLTWNVPLEAGGWLVGDQVNIEVELQAVKKVATQVA